jgi:multicomponent Na+:H+ antiporter subunit G
MILHFILLLGSLAFLIASLGLFRLPDALSRLHAGTKASSLAVLLMLGAAAVRFPSSALLCFGCVLLVFLTAPLGCHAIARRLVRLKGKNLPN